MANFRFYTNTPLNIGETIQLSASAAAHATRALRLNLDDEVIIFNGDGHDYGCTITSIEKNIVFVRVNQSQQLNNESPIKITLIQAISSGDRMDFTIQKAVELGVTLIQPITSQRSVVKLSNERAEKRIQHWQNIAISACEQSGRAVVPNVLAPLSLSQYFAKNTKKEDESILKITLAPTATKDLKSLSQSSHHIQLLIGAEGGLSDDEILLSQRNGFEAITLGKRILRTETAGLAAIASMQTLWGDF
jgi:16S rRNA (uracil1498-N3)-methyltransferase